MTTEPETIKQKLEEAWDSVAQEWGARGGEIDRFLQPATDWMMAKANLKPGLNLLDAACGAGSAGFDALDRIGPSGHLVGFDLSAEMANVAAGIVRQRGLENAVFRQADLEQIPFLNSAFDRAFCRFGLMFCPDPVKAAGELRRTLMDDGVLVGAVWGLPEQNPWSYTAIQVVEQFLDRPMPRDLPNAFSLGEPEELHRVLTAGGFDQVEIATIDHLTLGVSAEEYWERRVATAGPLKRIFKKLSPEQQAEANRAGREAYHRLLNDGGIRGVSLCFRAAP